MYGLDHLGIAKYGDLAAREHPEGWALGAFANTFGNAWPGIRKVLATGRCPRVRIHAIWDDGHQYKPSIHDPIINKELKAANALKADFPNVHVQFSPFCEHNIKGQTLVNLLNRCGDASRNVEIVNTPWQGDFSNKFMNEVHGTHKAPSSGAYQYSFDGTSCVDADVEKFKAIYSKAQVFYYWHSSFNGRLNTNDKTPRPQRKAWPTSQLIDSIIYLHRTKGQDNFKGKRLWKSHADRHNTPPEPRAYKPVVIVPEKVTRLELITENGQVIGQSGGPQLFNDGRWRYYFAEYGYLLAEKARRVQGHSIVKVRAGKKIIGSVNPAFRAGDFRN